jgi:polysaccharide transporter, PST family
MTTKYNKIRMSITNNTKVIENYFFMTALQIINALFGILIYPYLIRILGAGSYGLYVFAFSVTTYFVSFISFGFNMPAIKITVQNIDNLQKKNEIISSIFTAKSLLGILSLLVFLVLLFTVPFMQTHKLVFSICFVQIIAEVLFPVWYFQAIQKMRIVTFIQLGFRILSLPFIFIFIKKPEDYWMYALIATLSVVLSGFTSVLYLNLKEHIRYYFVSFRMLKSYFRDAMPFFWMNSTSTIKQESVTIIIGAFFGMKDVALYDLANKLILLPRMLTTSINGALFPKLIENIQKEVVKKIIRYETMLGLGVITGVVVFGRWIILILGGTAMLGSYPLAIFLSATVLVWLVVGCYISFIFVPNNRYYFVTWNQFVAFGTFFIFCLAGLLFYHNIMMVVIALSLSGLCEIVYCNYLIKKHNLQ